MNLRTRKALKAYSPALKAAVRRRKRLPKKKLGPRGDLYLIQGIFKGKTFWKVGRSLNAIQRFRQHKRDCKGVSWEYFQFWKAEYQVSAERAAHKMMRKLGFVQFNKVCSCKRLHTERFTLPGSEQDEAWLLAEYAVTRCLNV
ncbi:hypothetical protein V5O48_006557 [Marasmius crinis-equi]|uniref:Bacteriophage T5 Orf172 DNA-binding domain-containing protein n=1 Tax=Marasmius crinis-equi TaxID=585013 RepID=A0ABR3FJ55_9AGAR